MAKVLTPQVRYVHVKAHFRSQGESRKRLIRDYERQVAQPKLTEKAENGNTRTQTTQEG